jgi:hypothetical protein
LGALRLSSGFSFSLSLHAPEAPGRGFLSQLSFPSDPHELILFPDKEKTSDGLPTKPLGVIAGSLAPTHQLAMASRAHSPNLPSSFASAGGVADCTVQRRLVKIARYCSLLPKKKLALVAQCEKLRRSALLYSRPQLFAAALAVLDEANRKLAGKVEARNCLLPILQHIRVQGIEFALTARTFKQHEKNVGTDPEISLDVPDPASGRSRVDTRST